MGLCFTKVLSVLVYKGASQMSEGGWAVYYFACVSACERHLCYVEGENEDSCSFFASLIEFN